MPTDNTSHKQIHNIAEGYKPGDWLRQKRPTQDLGVSHNRGARVVVFFIDDILDLYSHRAFLESRAAFILVSLKNLQAEVEKHGTPESVFKYRELNRKFHQQIYLTSKHEYLIRALNQQFSLCPNGILLMLLRIEPLFLRSNHSMLPPLNKP